MRLSTLLLTALALLCVQCNTRTEEPWRFILLSDWHGAEIYVQPDLAPGMEEQLFAGMKMLKENFGGEFILMPGDACRGHWDTPQFIQKFNPELTPAEADKGRWPTI